MTTEDFSKYSDEALAEEFRLTDEVALRCVMAQNGPTQTTWDRLDAIRAELIRRQEATPALSDDRLTQLRDASTPAPGRDGVRIDGNGREWYSASWLGLRS